MKPRHTTHYVLEQLVYNPRDKAYGSRMIAAYETLAEAKKAAKEMFGTAKYAIYSRKLVTSNLDKSNG